MTYRRAAALLLAGAWASGASGQTTTLQEPDARLSEAYSFIQTVRALPDGRVMFADPLGQALVVADLDAQRADTLGRVGQGPQEYRQPDAVWPLPGDSTLVVDLGNGRLTAVAPDGTFAETWSIAQGEPGPSMVMALPRAVDGQGRIYVLGRPMPTRGGALPDSGAVLRLERGGGAPDTVATIKLEERRLNQSGGGGQQRVSVNPVPLSPADGWTVGMDGRIGVVRSADYHFEWIAPGGRVTAGPPVDYDPVRIGQAEKEEWARDQRNAGGGLAIRMTVEGGGAAQVSMSRGGADSGDDDPDLDQFDWPDVKPPFYDGLIPVDGRGRAWVRRHLDAGEPPMYDVFGSDARHVGSVVLPEGRRIVGFGDGVLYAVVLDEFDLNYLERYAIPAL